MCGIAGIVGEVDDVRAKLTRMAKAQAHRGPDGSEMSLALFVDTQVGLVHNYLDTEESGGEIVRQPYCDCETGLTVLMDGKIYNSEELQAELSTHYTFRTSCSSELISKAYHRWGASCLHRFRGMFSLVVYDPSAPHLFLARDRFGVKPFFYTFHNGVFYFASEIKALFAAGVSHQMVSQKWADYWVYGHCGLPDESFWEGVMQLPAGHCAYFGREGLDMVKWYVFEDEIKQITPFPNEKTAARRLLELAGESIQYHLPQHSDVGLNISGGVDSLFLLGLMQKHVGKRRLRVYSGYAGDKRHSEVLWANEMIAHTAYPMELVQLSTKMVKKEAIRMAQMQDEPFDMHGVLAYSRLFRAARKQNTIVLCDGVGIDEVWGRIINKPCAGIHRKPGYLNPDFAALARCPDYPHPFANEDDNSRYSSLFFGEIPLRLRCDDRTSMSHSTELRKPFLDHRLIEYAFMIPRYLKEYDGQDKWLIRRAVSILLPAQVRLAPDAEQGKQWSQWFTHEWKEWVDEAVESLLASSLSGWFDRPKLLQEWSDYSTGKEVNVAHVWQWLNLYLLLTKIG